MSDKTIFMKHADWEAWDTALRSGKYKQGTCVLHNREHNEYCCLGVLYDACGSPIPDRALPTMNWLEAMDIKFLDAHQKAYAAPYLPALRTSAAGANDRGVSFVKIANAIKKAVEFTDAEMA